jgi:hypothetical protein
MGSRPSSRRCLDHLAVVRAHPGVVPLEVPSTLGVPGTAIFRRSVNPEQHQSVADESRELKADLAAPIGILIHQLGASIQQEFPHL